jgi:hypothetical protein
VGSGLKQKQNFLTIKNMQKKKVEIIMIRYYNPKIIVLSGNWIWEMEKSSGNKQSENNNERR